MYLAMNDPIKALEAYENDLKKHPNRYNGIYGAAISAKLTGNNEKAKQYFESLLLLTEKSNSDRPELAEARSFIKSFEI
jgi:Tfp pilus assembly protein PilF